ncbi:hypothetical protein GCM10010174_69590 [Kutzneria viridogrisea]|uniref:Peptidase inhibitor family I36 n=1 Tax=Kutzneria viridogrisea TaxID=47990 RepID=A0ABR6BB03_9PSEU|nr:hypothetical protein [Kutzneria viridogrisea]
MKRLLAAFALLIALPLPAVAAPCECHLGSSDELCVWTGPNFTGQLYRLPVGASKVTLPSSVEVHSYRSASRQNALVTSNTDPGDDHALVLGKGEVAQFAGGDSADPVKQLLHNWSGRRCELGTKHQVCVWSGENFTGELLTLPVGAPNVFVAMDFTARSYQNTREGNMMTSCPPGGTCRVLNMTANERQPSTSWLVTGIRAVSG